MSRRSTVETYLSGTFSTRGADAALHSVAICPRTGVNQETAAITAKMEAMAKIFFMGYQITKHRTWQKVAIEEDEL